MQCKGCPSWGKRKKGRRQRRREGGGHNLSQAASLLSAWPDCSSISLPNKSETRAQSLSNADQSNLEDQIKHLNEGCVQWEPGHRLPWPYLTTASMLLLTKCDFQDITLPTTKHQNYFFILSERTLLKRQCTHFKGWKFCSFSGEEMRHQRVTGLLWVRRISWGGSKDPACPWAEPPPSQHALLRVIYTASFKRMCITIVMIIMFCSRKCFQNLSHHTRSCPETAGQAQGSAGLIILPMSHVELPTTNSTVHRWHQMRLYPRANQGSGRLVECDSRGGPSQRHRQPVHLTGGRAQEGTWASGLEFSPHGPSGQEPRDNSWTPFWFSSHQLWLLYHRQGSLPKRQSWSCHPLA